MKKRSIVMAVVLAALVAGMPIEAAAKKTKSLVAATVNGKRIKFGLNARISSSEALPFFTLGQKRRGGLLRTISVGCGLFPPTTVPGAGVACSGLYQEARLGRHPTVKAWNASTGAVQVTFDSYDGTQVAGRFSGTFTSLTGDAPVAIDGQFRGRVLAQ